MSVTSDLRRGLIFIHPSDELYGADRVLLDFVSALSEEELADAEFWLPTDVPHRGASLCEALESRGALVRHLDLPILRRAYARPAGIARLVSRLVRLAYTIRRRRPRGVYCTTSAALLAAPVARVVGVPSVLGHIQEFWSSSDRYVLGAAARACHRLIAISAPVRDQLRSGLANRCAVVLNATRPPGEFESLSGRTGPLHFVVASRWNGWKGHRTLLSAWDRVDAPGILTVLGGPPASGEITDVRSLRAGLRYPDSVLIVGEVPEIGRYLTAADVVVVPSDSPEPFGLVAIEAFARGRPVIGSDRGGLADIVTNGVDGWLFPVGDVAALARLLERLDRETITAAGGAAKARYEELFTQERYARDWREAVGFRAQIG